MSMTAGEVVKWGRGQVVVGRNPNKKRERGRRYLAGRGNLISRDLATIVMRSDA